MTNNNFIAMWVLSNYGGVGVIEMDSDSMLVQYYNDSPEWVEIQHEIDEDDEDNLISYIELGELKLDLNECMRTNIGGF